MKRVFFILMLVGCTESEPENRPQTCGNGACDATESAATCPADCGGGATCGNGTCEAGESVTCSQDCGSEVCGDGNCTTNEDLTTCPSDCVSAGRCGDGTCGVNESPANCVTDCGTCNSRCEGNDAHFCGDSGSDEFIACPAELATSCLSFDGGVACECGNVPEGEARCLAPRGLKK